jgi:hypothetical protein
MLRSCVSVRRGRISPLGIRCMFLVFLCLCLCLCFVGRIEHAHVPVVLVFFVGFW